VKGEKFKKKPYSTIKEDKYHRNCDKERPYRNWVWKARDPSCAKQVETMYAESLCKHMKSTTKRTKVALIGDSLQHVMYSSLVLQYGDSLEDKYNTLLHRAYQDINHAGVYDKITKEYRQFLNSSACNGTFSLIYFRSEHLDEPEGKRNVTFWKIVNESDIVVFNTGAHSHKINKRTRVRRMEVFAKRLNTLSSHVQLFWRTTVPGHVNCSSLKEPINHDLDANSSFFSNYNWSTFKDDSDMNLRILSRDVQRPVDVIDAYSLGLKRSDRHIGTFREDCLHYCLPGPPDDWVQLFLYQLRLRTENTRAS